MKTVGGQIKELNIEILKSRINAIRLQVVLEGIKLDMDDLTVILNTGEAT